MIHLAAKDIDGNESQLEKDKFIKVVFPNAGMQKGLRVFEGVNRDGEIRWRENGVLENIAFVDSLQIGKELYEFQCANCHSTNLRLDATGPALGNVHLFRTRSWLRSFTRNSYQMIVEGDSLALCLWNDWKPVIMNSYDTVLTDNQIDLIYSYLANESILQQIDTNEVYYVSECTIDSLPRNEGLEFVFDNTLVYSDPISMVSNIFQVNSLAWSNIDRFLNDPRTKPQKFFVRIKSVEEIKSHNVSIVSNKQNAYIPSFWKEDDLYSFTHNKR